MTSGTKPSLLILEDEASFLETLSLEFDEKGYHCLGARTIGEARSYLTRPIAFAILDLRVGEENGLAFLKELLASSPDCRAVILTGYGSIATAIQAVRSGAFNYLTKPAPMETLEKALWVQLENTGELTAGEVPSLARHEREYIEFVLARCNGNITHAAEKLGIHRQSLQRKLRKYSPRR
jgi:two-component system response regulator RegA